MPLLRFLHSRTVQQPSQVQFGVVEATVETMEVLAVEMGPMGVVGLAIAVEVTVAVVVVVMATGTMEALVLAAVATAAMVMVPAP